MNHVSATWNFLISSTRFMEKVKKKTETYFLCLSLTLDTVLSDSTPENFANIWQIKWNWIWQSIKFETVRIFFLVTFSVCCHWEILLPWQRDVTTSPLYSLGLRDWTHNLHRWSHSEESGNAPKRAVFTLKESTDRIFTLSKLRKIKEVEPTKGNRIFKKEYLPKQS